MTRLWRQPQRELQHGPTSRRRGLTKDQGNEPPSDTPPGRDGFASLTHLVLHGTDDVSFSPSSFFRRVEEVRALGSSLGDPLVAPSLSLPPPRPLSRPRRRPPPPVDEVPVREMLRKPSLSRDPTPAKAQATTEFDSVLELQALATELDELANSPPLAPHRLRASPTIKSAHPLPHFWPTSPLATFNSLGRDPLAELLAVADELKTMKSLDSDDILYMTDAPPPSPLPPNLHAFLDAPGISPRILEMDVHREDETFLGVPIPCIVVTAEGESLPTEEWEVHIPSSSPSEDLLAPPTTTYRGCLETDQPSIIIDDSDLSSPPALPLCEAIADREEEIEGARSPCAYPECSLAEANLSWEVISVMESSALSNPSTKPRLPTAPKPVPLLRRRERSLLRRILDGNKSNAQPIEKDKLWCIYPKQKRKRISKETIGLPRPLLSSSQTVTALPPCPVEVP
ncbi:hypothetical protein BC827DRAFT_1155843 [Russula dissimulans]|nr:hypothetical protein BC827DRAFT_1155843 [Russula dissimulans]